MADGVIGKVTAGGGTHLVTSTFYGTCETAKATVAKIVKLATAQTEASLITGMLLCVKFTAENTSSNPTLTIQNSSGTQLIAAKSIKRYGTTATGNTAATSWRAGAVVSFVYDGTNWVEISSMDDNTVYTHPTTAGNKHIPSGGSANQALKYSASGTAVWGTPSVSSTSSAIATVTNLDGTDYKITFSNALTSASFSWA